jgi:hypothetical protein
MDAGAAVDQTWLFGNAGVLTGKSKNIYLKSTTYIHKKCAAKSPCMSIT